MTPTVIFAFKVIIHLMCLGYIGTYYYWAFTDNLGADPVKAIIHFTGMSALNLLLLTLTISPIVKITRQTQLIKIRRLLGLYSFTFALLHLTNYLAFDLQFAFNTLVEDIIERPYITVGFAALIILFALAITSLDKLKRRMRKNWQKLHNTIYLASILIALHYIWSVKSLDLESLLYFSAIIGLLCLRISWINKKLFKK